MAIFKKERFNELNAAQPSPQHTILLVDDEPDNLSVLSSILSHRYRILRANDGQEALDMVHAMERPEELTLVISDQRMPRLTGVQFCEKLCEIAPSTVRIIVTGYIDIDAIVDSVNRARIYQFVIKPFDRHDFELTVQRAVEAFEMQRELDDYVRNLEAKVEARTDELQQRNDELQNAYAQLQRLSITDALTGLHNRHYLHSVLAKDIALALRAHESKTATHDGADGGVECSDDLVFFLIDCDHFKQVNDQYGHDVGDQLLVAIADVLRKIFRESDHLVRWGGEEFLVVARFIARSQAGELAERLRSAMAEMSITLADGRSLQRSCSIGFASLPFFTNAPEAVTWPQVVKLADCALYCAKNSGRNRWVGLSAGTQAGMLLPLVQHSADIPALLERGVLQVQAMPATDALRWS